MIKMKAAKRFRLPEAKGFRWLDSGELYTVETDATADYHEKSGRGTRVQAPAKSGKKGD